MPWIPRHLVIAMSPSHWMEPQVGSNTQVRRRIKTGRGVARRPCRVFVTVGPNSTFGLKCLNVIGRISVGGLRWKSAQVHRQPASAIGGIRCCVGRRASAPKRSRTGWPGIGAWSQRRAASHVPGSEKQPGAAKGRPSGPQSSRDLDAPMVRQAGPQSTKSIFASPLPLAIPPIWRPPAKDRHSVAPALKGR